MNAPANDRLAPSTRNAFLRLSFVLRRLCFETTLIICMLYNASGAEQHSVQVLAKLKEIV